MGVKWKDGKSVGRTKAIRPPGATLDGGIDFAKGGAKKAFYLNWAANKNERRLALTVSAVSDVFLPLQFHIIPFFFFLLPLVGRWSLL
jgi:hypothetical protein